MWHDTPHLILKKKDHNNFYGIIGVKHWYDDSPYTGSMYLQDNYLNSELANEKLEIPKDSKGEALITKNKQKYL